MRPKAEAAARATSMGRGEVVVNTTEPAKPLPQVNLLFGSYFFLFLLSFFFFGVPLESYIFNVF